MRVGFLIAGGQGRRMGLPRPKALAPFAGRTLVEHAHAALRECCDRIVLVAPASVELPMLDGARVHDAGEGSLAAAAAGFATTDFEMAIVLGVDLPFVTGALLRALAERAAGGAALAAAGGREQPLASAWCARLASRLVERVAAGERAFVGAAIGVGAVAIDVETLGFEPGVLENVNTPADLERAERRARGTEVA